MSNNVDWTKLGFNTFMGDGMMISYFRNGAWSLPEFVRGDTVSINMWCGAFHYASSCFEGLKAFRGVDGKVRMFRPDENFARMSRAANLLGIAMPHKDMFIDMCAQCVMENVEYLPPYGSGASVYIRPLLMSCNPQIGLGPSTEAVFIVMSNPVGSYFAKDGLAAVTALICRTMDRAAPLGTGSYKISANYAQTINIYDRAHRAGYGELLFLDSLTHTKIDEFGSSNFFAIKGNKYITPQSDSILPSITNKSLRQIAADMGMEVEVRPVYETELPDFEEVNACGTAVVITPVSTIYDKPSLESDTVTAEYHYGKTCGPVSAKLYDMMGKIRNGEVEDIHNWCLEIG